MLKTVHYARTYSPSFKNSSRKVSAWAAFYFCSRVTLTFVTTRYTFHGSLKGLSAEKPMSWHIWFSTPTFKAKVYLCVSEKYRLYLVYRLLLQLDGLLTCCRKTNKYMQTYIHAYICMHACIHTVYMHISYSTIVLYIGIGISCPKLSPKNQLNIYFVTSRHIG